MNKGLPSKIRSCLILAFFVVTAITLLLPAVTYGATNLPVIGCLDAPGQGQNVTGTINISGWALDGNNVAKLDVLIDGNVQGQAIYGDSRPDVFKVFPQYQNSNAGYHYALDTRKLTNGSHTVAIRETSNNGTVTTLSQRTINVANLPAVVWLDSPGQGQNVTGTVNISGWALDGDSVTQLDVLVDGVVQGQATYGDARLDVAKAFPAYNNNNSGFHYSLDTTHLGYGTHTITIRETSLNGSQTNIPSRTINILKPIGCIDNPSQSQSINSVVTVSGWALDPNGVTKLEVLIDGNVQGQAIYGDSRPDVFRVFPQYQNSNAGYHYALDTRKLTNGSHTVVIRETSNNGTVTYLLQRTINVANLPAVVWLDSPGQGQNVTGTVNISGWALDGDSVTQLDVLVDGVVQGQAAYGDARLDVAKAFPAYNNNNSGFHYSLDTTHLGYGTHTITIRETSLNVGQTNIAVRNINILPPLGWIDNPSNNQSIGGTVNVSGWFLDGSGAAKVEVLIDGVLQGQAVYGDSRPDVEKAFSAYNNANSGYHFNLDTSTISSGVHTLQIRDVANNGTQTILQETILVNVYRYGADSGTISGQYGSDFYIGQLGYGTHQHFAASTGGDDAGGAYFSKTAATNATWLYGYWLLSGMDRAPAGTSAAQWGQQQAQAAVQAFNDMNAYYGSKVKKVIFVDVEYIPGGLDNGDYANNQAIYTAFINWIRDHSAASPGTYSSPYEWSYYTMGSNFSPLTPGYYWVADYPSVTPDKNSLTTANGFWVNFPQTNEQAEIWQYEGSPDYDVARSLPG